MKYRKYYPLRTNVLIAVFASTLVACATTKTTQPQPSSETEKSAQAPADPNDGREPASMQGDVAWLNDVEDKFSRIASETSTRAVASDSKQEVLVKQKDWAFSFLPKTNHFYLSVQGISYMMVQARISEGDQFAFAAEGQSENPITFSVTKGQARSVASADATCDTEISYWDKKTKSYVSSQQAIKGKSCGRMLSLLKDYVP